MVLLTAVFHAPIRNVRFTGRDAALLGLREKLLSGDTPVVLQGMGGIGKTQIAMEYAHRFRTDYDLVWWIDADPAVFVDTALADLAHELGVPAADGIAGRARAVLAALSRGVAPRWLIVFDNAENIDVVSRFLPGPGGHVIVTSRDPGWADLARAVPVDGFERAESVAHLRERVPAMSEADAARLAEALGELPIAVAAAGAWLADTGQTAGDYLGQVGQFHLARVEAVWELSLARLRERSAAAYRLLELCSMMTSHIALDLIYSDAMAGQLDPPESVPALVQQINRLALLKIDDGQIFLHRLLQQVVRERMSPQEQETARHQVHRVLAAARPAGEVDDPATWPAFGHIWPHLEVTGAAECRDEPVRQLIIDRLRYVWLSGGFDDGRRMGEEFAARWERHRQARPGDGPLERQLLHLRFTLANILSDQAAFAEARALDEAVLARQRELLGEHHPHTLMTANGLGRDLRALGLYDEALKRDQGTYAAWSATFGDDHPRTMSALNNLAVSERLAGRAREAAGHERAVYERCSLVLGPRHALTLIAGNNLGRDLREAGEYEASIALLTDVLGRHRETGTPRTYSTMANLAVSERSAGHVIEAAAHLDAAYAHLAELLGPGSPETLACRLSRAVGLLEPGELAEVEAAYRRSLGDTHPYTITCRNNRAAAARADGDLSTARRLAEQAAQEFAVRLGEGHPSTLAARTNVAILEAETGAVGDARAVIEPVVAALDALLGPEHPDAIRAAADLALMGGADGDAEIRLTAALGGTHPAVRAFREGRYLHRTLDPHPF
ncbi:FxSxx-COOH system tetratricopeptide repeat protein [Paractinoplanes atraurantiacus]|uniref:Tetratricopeptide repeat-containing protein n=1 Tax=Paractinoplanes atraurantiacus TaxID=1036182 RepID=A0A285I9J0_9ACTN|nr:FxSxx-COOH system tetratricopeptide repeat protein [Actinoplanes atraurantiacus]SNY44642.1 Tetratricopeptide repeat-containing protein [Actinoplanes atraurantiacus]